MSDPVLVPSINYEQEACCADGDCSAMNATQRNIQLGLVERQQGLFANSLEIVNAQNSLLDFVV